MGRRCGCCWNGRVVGGMVKRDRERKMVMAPDSVGKEERGWDGSVAWEEGMARVVLDGHGKGKEGDVGVLCDDAWWWPIMVKVVRLCWRVVRQG